MADLNSDIIGQVARLPLKPSEANALLPMFEAVSNSLHAIHDRFGDDQHAEKGRIDIEVIRADLKDGEGHVIGFEISDNGIGLNEQNFNSFCTPFSQHKIKRGGKGVGRLGWLKVFDKINIKSNYLNDKSLHGKEFDFVLRKRDQIALKDDYKLTAKEPGTVVHMTGFKDSFGSRCPVKQSIIIQRTIAHFLPVFAGDKAPKIYIHDNGIVDLKEEFKDKITISDEQLIEIEIEGELTPIIVRHMQCNKSIRPRGSINNWMCFCANDRGVKEYGIDNQIGLKSLDGEEIYVGTVTGDYLDIHVNPQRTDFIFDAEEGKLIRRQVAVSVRKFLSKYIEEALAQKKVVTNEVIKKNPQYLYLKNGIDEFVSGLQASSTSEENIFLEMSQHRFRRQRQFGGVRKEIEHAPKYDDAIADKVEEYKKYLLDDKKGTLAEYVTKRKAVLDLLDKLKGFTNNGDKKHHLEDAIHKLICPMRIDSSEVTIDDHNLWVLDDRLAFFSFFASDKTIKSFMDSDSTREPDIALFYDSCIAWRESDRACDSVILVEFKRPGLEKYSDKNDPFMQLIDYVSLFKSGKTVRDKSGGVISGIGSNTAFQCYIVADLTEGLRRRLRGSFEPTPDGKGLFGYTRNPDSYVEVIPYDKLLSDAQARNAVFFDKLGIAD